MRISHKFNNNKSTLKALPQAVEANNYRYKIINKTRICKIHKMTSYTEQLACCDDDKIVHTTL